MAPQNNLIAIDGSHLSVIDVGCGPAVVLGHGFMWDSQMWAPQIAALKGRYRVIVPELWGHGRSGPMPSSTRSLADVARQHLAMLDHLEIESTVVVGLSAGGMWGAELAFLAPERLSALVLLDTSLAPEPVESQRGFLGMLDLIEQTGAVPSLVLDALAGPLFFSSSVDKRHPGLRQKFRESLMAWNVERLLDSVVPLGRMICDRRDAMDKLAVLPMPAMVATGVEDQARPPAEGRAMATRLRCDFVEIPEAGHMTSLEAPEMVNRLLADFLAKNAPT